jgi:hypothetical protein
MKTRWLVLFLLLAGFTLRLYDLTDLPLDFHPTRQLFGLIKARGMYYAGLGNIPQEQRQLAIELWKAKTTFEPQIMEHLTVFAYRFIGEQFWVARIYSSIFWVLGGLFLFLLVRDLFNEQGALLSLTFYLFLPYGLIASRSFQPDPLMTMLTIIFWWSVNRWSKHPNSWTFAITAGLFGGLAIVMKFVAAFFVLGAGLGALIMSLRAGYYSRQSIFPLTVMVFLGITPGASWVLYGTYFSDFLVKKFEGRFIPELLISPSFYLGWFTMMNASTGLIFVMLGLLGLYFARERTFPLSLWIAYGVYAIAFDYHISTHDYYSLLLIPVTAVSLAPLADLQIKKLDHRIPVALFALISTVIFIQTLSSVDYRPQAKIWQTIDNDLEPRAKLTSLTDDYGMRLEYWGWRKSAAWPLYGDLYYHEDIKGAKKEFEKRFSALTNGRNYFIVTQFDELERQPELKEKLSTYPILTQTEDFIIYKLNR